MQYSVKKTNSIQISINNDFFGVNPINTSLFGSPNKNKSINKKFVKKNIIKIHLVLPNPFRHFI